MLGKLIKYEWKETCKIGLLMVLVLLGITFFGWLAFQSPMWNALSTEVYTDSAFSILDLLSVFTLVMYFVMLLVVPIALTIYLVIRFFRTMYSAQGYLTHTLPVTKNQLLVSKVLIAGIWELLISVAVVASVVGLFVFMFNALLPDGYTLSSMWAEITLEIDEDLFTMLREEVGIDLRVYAVFGIVTMLVSPFTTMIIYFGAVSMGQLFPKCRVLMAIVSYFVIMVFNGILSMITEGFFSAAVMDSVESVGSYVNTNLLINFLMNIVLAAILYWVSYYVADKRLNME